MHTRQLVASAAAIAVVGSLLGSVTAGATPLAPRHPPCTINSDGYATGNDTNSGNGITTQWHMEAAFPCGG